MGNTAVSQRKHCQSDRPKSADDLGKDDYHKQLINELINTNYPAKRARSKSWKASSSGSAKPVTSAENNGKFHVSKKNQSWKRPELYYPAMIPEPDYSDSEEENSPNSSPLKTSNQKSRQQRKAHKLNLKNNGSSTQQQHQQHRNMTTTAGTNGSVQLNEDGLVIPKKLGNPCLTSQERQNLHKELMFNQKIGKSVLGQKSELQKVMEKFRDDQKKKELEGEKMNKRSSFEKRLEEQASKIKEIGEDTTKKPEEVDQPEFLRVHARVRANTFPVDTES